MSVAAEPTTRVSRGWTVRFGLLWFGFWAANLAPVQLVLPNQFDHLDHAHKVRDFGVVSGISGVAALIALPLFGALCDRTRSRFGRRRVWMIGGTVLFAGGLIATGAQTTWVGVGIAWVIATLGIDAATAGATAAIADEVPDQQRGAISAAIYGPQAVGILVGVALLSALNNNGVLGYGVLATVLVGCALPFLMWYRDAPGIPTPQLSLRSIVTGLWVRSADFGWAFGGRLLVNLGNALGTTYLLYFLQDDLKLDDPDNALLLLTLVYLAFTLVATVMAGRASDRSGRRRSYVALAAILQAIASFLLTFYPTYGVALVGAAFLGAGYGAYMSVDQALVTAVLPDAASRAKDLGIMNVGSVGPQALAPLAASLIISELGGYPVLFAASGITTVLGALFVYRIRSVR
ncbi:MAG TPA: MFS transporter [Jatrophihabitantaceae bacterium]|jgi:MFS family permease|nr:MFS transporter [Jatrophihabitantaceae bacterium]